MPRISVPVSVFSAREVGSTLVVPVYDKKDIAVSLPASLQKTAEDHMRQLEFSGHWGAAELVADPSGRQVKFFALVGIGPKDSTAAEQAEGLRRGLGKVLQECRRHILRQVDVVVPTRNADVLSQAAVEAAELVTYRFVELRKQLQKDQAKRALQKLNLLVEGDDVVPVVKKAVTKARTVAAGVELARTLVDQPAGHASPLALVEAARAITKESKGITLTVLDRKQAAKKKFNAFLAVARGSSQEPYVIHMKYKHPRATRKIALVGKGITFDSGGLSLKPAQNMADMKIDMAGAATVLGVFAVLSKLNIPVEVHGIIAACENMPSGNAYRPGDVIEAMNGKTIEILNTDAEGRVTLADALTYACQQKVDTVIDLATLTGAVMVALGETHAGLWTNSEKLRDALLDSAKDAGEGMVSLPLPEEYKAMIQSLVADISNAATNSPMGGAITAALFLQEFIQNVDWAHLDVAGPVYMSKPLLPYFSRGATGYGVRTLVNYLEESAKI